jgi:hypothetical protein
VDADTFDRRLGAASDRLRGLATRLESSGPWPLAERFDHAPEAEWGPRETLAHLEEMLSFWLGEMERVVDMTGGPAPFGRVATDGLRLAVIERDRTLPIRELLARVQNGIARWRTRWAELDDADRGRTGIHATLGSLQVSDIATRFVAHHLEEHLDQLQAALSSNETET